MHHYTTIYMQGWIWINCTDGRVSTRSAYIWNDNLWTEVGVTQGGKTFRVWRSEVICTGIDRIKLIFNRRLKGWSDAVFSCSYRNIYTVPLSANLNMRVRVTRESLASDLITCCCISSTTRKLKRYSNRRSQKHMSSTHTYSLVSYEANNSWVLLPINH